MSGPWINKLLTILVMPMLLVACGGETSSYPVHAVLVEGVSIAPASRTVASGDSTEFTITADEGYDIVSVSGCGGSLHGATYITAPISGACEIAVGTSRNSYTVTTSAGAGGSLSPNNPTVSHGASFALAVSPGTGYAVDSVSGCNGTLDGHTYTTGPMTGACEVTASFKLKSYTVTTSVGEGGSLSPANPITAEHGEVMQLTVAPEAGYVINSVSGCSGTLNGATYTTGPIIGACEVTAGFTEIPDAPGNLVAVRGSGAVTLSWSGVADAEGYHLYYATEAGIEPVNIQAWENGTAVKNVMSPRIVSGLDNGVIHYFVVTAVLQNAESGASDEVAAIPNFPGALNDTGIDWCFDGSSTGLGCPAASHPGQDGDVGRDAQARDDTLDKIGSGVAGFDFTKLGANGEPLAVQDQPWDGDGDESAGTRWSCVRDNYTGLTWEIRNNDGGLRDKDHTYTWYNPDAGTNGGNAGSQDGGSCTGSDCDTFAYVQAVNAQGLCGADDWRLPTRMELRAIAHRGVMNPAIDQGFFPDVRWDYDDGMMYAFGYWSAAPHAGNSNSAWAVTYRQGEASWRNKSNDHAGVRLVRSGE